MPARFILLLSALLAAAPAQALYDPAPDATLAAIEGEWHGSLAYRDYSPPHGIVTLPTGLFVALGAHDELVMHYVYDDGPGKTVHSYETVRFEPSDRRVTWTTGSRERATTVGHIVSDTLDGTSRRIVVEATDEDGKARHTFEFARDHVTMRKEEVEAGGAITLRHTYDFKRP
jgi:hypothetical protein